MAVTKTQYALAICAAIFWSSGASAQQADAIVTDIQQYDNGGIYEGEFRNGVQHGQGTYRLPNGYEYTGTWVDGEIRGQGRAVFPDRSIYEGEFLAGRPPRDGQDHLCRWLYLRG